MRRAAEAITFLVVEELYPIRVVAVTEAEEVVLNYGDDLLVAVPAARVSVGLDELEEVPGFLTAGGM